MYSQNVQSRQEKDTKSSLTRLYEADIRHGAEMLGAVMQILRRDEGLRNALTSRDRGQLLARAAPLFAGLRQQLGITHLYFSGPNRVNLLRVHQPGRHGDIIGRYTTVEAERSGNMVSGVELGLLGTLTLRLVDPWYADADKTRLLGYVEFGMEVDHVLHGAQHFLDMPIFVLISKEHLARADWETGMRMLGREADWERFPDAVLSTQAEQTIPPPLATHFAQALTGPGEADFPAGSSFYRTVSVPLHEATGRPVGRMVAVIDVSSQIRAMRRVGYTAGLAALGAASVLFVFSTGWSGASASASRTTRKNCAVSPPAMA